MIEFPATNEAMRALLLGDIAGIRNVEALESWGFAFASAIARLPAANLAIRTVDTSRRYTGLAGWIRGG